MVKAELIGDSLVKGICNHCCLGRDSLYTLLGTAWARDSWYTLLGTAWARDSLYTLLETHTDGTSLCTGTVVHTAVDSLQIGTIGVGLQLLVDGNSLRKV